MRYGWGAYVPVGQKKNKACKFADKVAKKQKRARQPITVSGRSIAKSFWGKAWCDHLESLSDYANRLPRGRTYVRNGSVVDLIVQPGGVNAIVAGSDPYKVAISIKQLDKKSWSRIKRDCAASIDSLIDLLGGRLSDGVMQRLTDAKSGCFPSARQISMGCSCPDWSACCKHIAAVMYAIGSRLDAEPELLFLLRGVNQEELIGQAVSKENLSQELASGSGDGSGELAGQDLGELFGIELDSAMDSKPKVSAKRKKSKSATLKDSGKKRAGKKKASTKKATTKKASTKKAKQKTAKAVKKVTGKTGRKKQATTAASAKKKAVAKKVKSKTVKKRAVKKKVTARSTARKTKKR